MSRATNLGSAATQALRAAPAALVDAGVGALGLWQFFALSAVFLGWSFDTLARISPVALLGLALPALTRPWDTPPSAPEVAPPARRPWWAWVAGAVGVGAVLAFQAGSLEFRGLAVLLLPMLFAGLSFATPVERLAPADLRAGPLDLVSVVGTAACAALLTSWLCRPDVDDAYYMAAVSGHLAHPTLAVQSFDVVHGDPSAPIQQVAHRPQTFEPFAAVLSRFAGLDPRTTYWLVLPALAAAASAFAHWVLSKSLAPRLAWLATPLGLFVLTVWGDTDRTFGRFAYVRLFQGKSVFATVLVPVVVYAAWRFVTAPSWRSWLRLVLVQLAATLFTSTALVVAPVSAGLAVLAGVGRSRRRLAVTAAGLAASAPVVVALFLLWLEIRAAGGLASDGETLSVFRVVGDERGGLALFAVALVPWLLPRGSAGATATARLGFVAMALLLHGESGRLLGASAASLLGWRVYWGVPVPVAVALVGAAGAAAVVRGLRGRAWVDAALGLGALVTIAAFEQSGSWTTERFGVRLEWWTYKTLKVEDMVADRILKLVTPEDVVAAPSHLAQALAMRPVRPKLVAVWHRYVVNLTRWWGPAETQRRLAVYDYIRGKTWDVPESAMDETCVRVLALTDDHRDHPESGDGLRAMGFTEIFRGNYDLWERPVASLPTACGRGE